jgi:hypothetical protein
MRVRSYYMGYGLGGEKDAGEEVTKRESNEALNFGRSHLFTICYEGLKAHGIAGPQSLGYCVVAGSPKDTLSFWTSSQFCSTRSMLVGLTTPASLSTLGACPAFLRTTTMAAWTNA